jgi:hypothetical protein
VPEVVPVDGEQKGGHACDRDDPRNRHPRGEDGTGESLVREHDQVRQVRARQQERRGVRREDRAVEKGLFAVAPPPRGMDEHGRQEDDGRVEVEDRRHDRVERDQREQQRRTAAGQSSQSAPDALEDGVVGRDGADREQPGDEDECRPRLRRGRARIRGAYRRRRHRTGAAGGEER